MDSVVKTQLLPNIDKNKITSAGNKQLFIQNKVHVFSSNFALYGDMSARVMNTLTRFTPDIEIYSIDEAFLNLLDEIRHNLK